jgi:transcriptional regulator with XRE-family HTH domain
MAIVLPEVLEVSGMNNICGQYIKSIRMIKGKSCIDLENDIEIDRGHLSRVENGKQNFGKYTESKLFNYFEMTKKEIKKYYILKEISKDKIPENIIKDKIIFNGIVEMFLSICMNKLEK